MSANNPAGRLHRLLLSFDETAENGLSIAMVWAKVLDVEQEKVLPALSRAAALVYDIKAALSAAGDLYQLEVFDHFGPAWARVLFAPEVNMQQTSPSPAVGLIDRGSLVALGGVAAFLGATAAEGVSPREDIVEGLKEQVQDLLDTIRSSDELDEKLKALLLDHVHRLAWALDDVAFGGPGGVKAASERLAGAVGVLVPADQRGGLIGRSLQVAGAAWIAFSAGPTVQQALEAWNAVAGALPPG